MAIFKGQSSVEYLTTYGWMLIAVTVAGSTIYTQTDFQQGCTLQTNGFSPPFPTIKETYQYENNTVVFSLRNPSNDQVRINSIQIYEEGERIGSFTVNKQINGEASEIISTNRFKDSENCKTRRMEIKYSGNQLENLTSQGTIRGKIDLTPLIASFTYYPVFADPGQKVTFNASNSEGENSINNYTWSFGDGDTGKGTITNNTYPSPGAYTVKLTIKDQEGVKATKEKQLFIGGVIRRKGGQIDSIQFKNTLATGCIGNNCEDPNASSEEIVTTDGDFMTGTLKANQLFKINPEMCLTSEASLDADRGCTSVRQGPDKTLSQQQNTMNGSLQAPVIKPMESSILCIGSKNQC